MDEAVLTVRREVIGMPDKKRIALVTGASSGLGREFARLLAHEAVDELWLVARREERLRELAVEVVLPCRVFALDLTQESALEALSAALSAEPVTVRWLVNAAGFGRIGMAADIGAATTGRMIALNCRAAAELTERVLLYMERGSRVLEIASCAAFQPIPYLAAYAATKAFLLRYSRALAAEVAERGITVTAICPYWIRDTEFIHEAKRTDKAGLFRGFPLATDQKTVARRSLWAAEHGFTVFTPDLVSTLHRIITSLLPHRLMIALSNIWRHLAG